MTSYARRTPRRHTRDEDVREMTFAARIVPAMLLRDNLVTVPDADVIDVTYPELCQRVLGRVPTRYERGLTGVIRQAKTGAFLGRYTTQGHQMVFYARDGARPKADLHRILKRNPGLADTLERIYWVEQIRWGVEGTCPDDSDSERNNAAVAAIHAAAKEQWA